MEKLTMLSFFRKLSLIEGLSLIILLFVAMPAKYQFGYVDSIWQLGMAHGLLWLAHFIFSLVVSHQQKWSVMFWVLVLFASVIPFACFFLDRKLNDKSEVSFA